MSATLLKAILQRLGLPLGLALGVLEPFLNAQAQTATTPSARNRTPAILHQADRPRLLVKNTFESPEAVLRHFCARDAWGFVWSGMMAAEVRALTQWKFAPQTEGFQVIQGYSFGPTQSRGPDEVLIPVTYQVLGVGQASGAFVPLDSEALQAARTQVVRYRLTRVAGRWKIVSPEPTQIEPHVLVDYSPARPPEGGASPTLPKRLRDLQ